MTTTPKLPNILARLIVLALSLGKRCGAPDGLWGVIMAPERFARDPFLSEPLITTAGHYDDACLRSMTVATRAAT